MCGKPLSEAGAAGRAWPTVSVVVPNYNGRRYLGECFRSLQETLDYPQERLQLILVDNGSRDGSAHYMKAHFPQVKVIGLSQNLGFARANNIGAEQASGEYLAFLNNDVRVHPDWLIELVSCISKREGAVCAGSKILSWDGRRIDFVGGAMNFHGRGFQVDYGKEYEGGYEEDKETLFACGAAMLIQRDVFLDCGGFDESFFAYYEDVDLGWRLWVLGYRVVFAGKSVAYHRHHGTTQRVPEVARLLLRERQALYSIIKNYESETLNRVLPVALLLLIKRLYLESGIDPKPYRLELQPEVRGKPSSILPAIRQAAGHLLGGEIIPSSAFSEVIAVSDVIEHYPTLLKKREKIQAARRRTDREVSRLFGFPFQFAHSDPRYQEDQNRLVQASGLDQLWETGS